ncbi:debranching enzyme 1 [Actinidia rufa]|uniref:Debranching enzyme 1 n=1 Tax=Actinidia rufa TaxID=165716 RepID=A0A7J0EHT0_9ERIC|nr:debranching enzyme 1 [Actinidia rufa]
MKIAVEGCMHGDLDNVYTTLLHIQEVEKTKIDLLICCGDFQAVRNERDLESLNVKPKYRSMNSFWKYYSGEKVAPFPTIFIGGNHEASNYLWELYYGGWTAPDIYFLGFAGVVKFGNIRIGGLSGIYKANHYHLGHYERLPYNESDIRSIYHVREYDVHKLMQVEEPIDIFLSHDWPLGITDHGNWKELIRHKPFFEQESPSFMKKGPLTRSYQPFLKAMLKVLKAFKKHCNYMRILPHAITIRTLYAQNSWRVQVIEIESEPGPYEIQYDEEWLAVTRKFNCVFPRTTRPANFGGVQLDMQECRKWVSNRLRTRGAKPSLFVRTVPCHNPSQPVPNGSFTVILEPSKLPLPRSEPPPRSPFQGVIPSVELPPRSFPPSDPLQRPPSTRVLPPLEPFGLCRLPARYCRNPQTEAFLQFLELPYLLDNATGSREQTNSPASFISRGVVPFDHDSDVDEIEELSEVHDTETQEEIM